ncbi:hypothetical protein cyc_00843 [Cyclospora cayetanensis]|uniref:Rieske domain-containing protein n=1 Tax=Cyclospora cayetanensis TaxID=88456 RepID=A0A1D3CX47_9EIME|nr:hypothetical protein cyc_00843 [Cyclospora cayetanensis]
MCVVKIWITNCKCAVDIVCLPWSKPRSRDVGARTSAAGVCSFYSFPSEEDLPFSCHVIIKQVENLIDHQRQISRLPCVVTSGTSTLKSASSCTKYKMPRWPHHEETSKGAQEKEVGETAIPTNAGQPQHSYALSMSVGLAYRHRGALSLMGACSSSRKPHALRLLGMSLVVYRQSDGRPSCLEDRCPLNSCRLSMARVVNGRLECNCRCGVSGGIASLSSSQLPDTKSCGGAGKRLGERRDSRAQEEGSSGWRRAAALPKAFPCVDFQGYIWARIAGNAAADAPKAPPSFPARAAFEAKKVSARFFALDLPVEARCLLESILAGARLPLANAEEWAPGAPLEETEEGVAVRQRANWRTPTPLSFPASSTLLASR